MTHITDIIVKIVFVLSSIHLNTCAGIPNLSKDLPPIILIPGDGGNQIQARINKSESVHYICYKNDGWFDLWLNKESLIPFIIDCWVDNIRLVYNKTTRTTSPPPGVETRVIGFGNTYTVEWLDPSNGTFTDYFYNLVEGLVTLGYERNKSIYGAPYDFRKAPNELKDYFDKLKDLVEYAYFHNGFRKVVLLPHSMGGPMVSYFLKGQPQEWKNKYIECVIGIAGAWGGAIKAVKVYAAGDNLGIFAIPQKALRTEQRTDPSLAYLLPSRNIWDLDYTLVQTPFGNFTTFNFKEYFEALKLPDAYEMYLDTKDLNFVIKSLGVPMHLLYGTHVPTVERLIYTTNSSFPDNPTIVNGDGDGTVNRASLELPAKWIGVERYPVKLIPFKGLDHMACLKNKEPIEKVKQLITEIANSNAKSSAQKEEENVPSPNHSHQDILKLLKNSKNAKHINSIIYRKIVKKYHRYSVVDGAGL